MGIPLGSVFKSCFIVFPMSFKSSCISPPRTVTNILEKCPQPPTSILANKSCTVWWHRPGYRPWQTTTARTGVYYCYSHFGFLKEVCVCVSGGIQPGCGADWVKRQMKLSVIGGATQLTVGMQLKWVREDNESSVIKMMWRARPEHVKDQMTVCG